MDEIEELPASRTSSSSPRSVSELGSPVCKNTLSLPRSADELCAAAKDNDVLDDNNTLFVQCSPTLVYGIVLLVVLILAILVVACVQETIH